MDLTLVPLSLRVANEYISEHHRHHKPVRGCKFNIGVLRDGDLCAVAITGRPVARMLDDGYTAEVTRLCTDGTPNACSMLYGASWRAAKAMGYLRIVTYILESEEGTSLRAAGWTRAADSSGGTWSRPSRSRTDSHPLEPKVRYEKAVS